MTGRIIDRISPKSLGQLPPGISVSRAVERSLEDDNATMDQDNDSRGHGGEYYSEDLDSSAQDCSTGSPERDNFLQLRSVTDPIFLIRIRES